MTEKYWQIEHRDPSKPKGHKILSVGGYTDFNNVRKDLQELFEKLKAGEKIVIRRHS